MTTPAFTKEQLADIASDRWWLIVASDGEPFEQDVATKMSSDLAAFALSLMERAETAWLIEMKDYVHPVPAWWGGTRYGWRHDASEAVRFCREVDAERVIESMPWKHNAIATQHSWISPMQKAEEGE